MKANTKMATKDITAEQLLEVLKFTPRTYKIQMWGYGGEKVMGRVDREVWDYCMENQVNLMDIAWNSDGAEDLGLDPDKLPFPPGSWYECDGIAHVNGVCKDAGTIQIFDEQENVVYERQLNELNGDPEDNSPELECFDDVGLSGYDEGDIIFIGQSNEKGVFFEGEIELKAPFDIAKLKLRYDEIDAEEIINGVEYDGEEIDNWGGGTDGKSSDMDMYIIDEDREPVRYEPEEKDWGHPEYGTSPESWESSPTFKFKKHKPVHPGYYSANYGYGSTYGSLYWDGNNFGEWEYGKFNPVSDKSVVSWQGFNWDTSDWANRPPVPFDVSCDNKKCDWVGNGDDRREDEDYNNHCPECDGTEFSWIDYDPDTAKGRKNREKYCKPIEYITLED